MKFTILGSSGFIGSHLATQVQQLGMECFTPSRHEQNISKQELGHIIYSIGLTADFRCKPFETVKAHVCYLLEILEQANFESFLYLSSTRLYAGLEVGYEDSPLKAIPSELSDLYNLSKMMGESICFASPKPHVRVARLSNVYGRDFSSTNFLASVIREAVVRKKVFLQTALASEKDYISIDEVVDLLLKISVSGQYKLYNVASGINTSHQELLELIKRETACIVEVMDNAELVRFPQINIDRIKHEFNFSPLTISQVIPELVKNYKPEGKNMIKIDIDNEIIVVESNGGNITYPLSTPEAFSIISELWLRCGWDNKYVYSFSWLGRPIMNLSQNSVQAVYPKHANGQ